MPDIPIFRLLLSTTLPETPRDIERYQDIDDLYYIYRAYSKYGTVTRINGSLATGDYISCRQYDYMVLIFTGYCDEAERNQSILLWDVR